jgi:hypothetical protein
MTTAHHTPGPWEHDGQFIVAPDPQGIHPDIYIAEIVQKDDEGRMASPDQQLANGALIAAATEMLDALFDIKRLAEKSGDSEADPFALLDLIADEARTALVNATPQ